MYRIVSTALALFLACVCLQAQDWKAELRQKHAKTGTSPSYHEIVDAFDKYWADKPDRKGKGYKPFKRAAAQAQKLQTAKGPVNPNVYIQAWKETQAYQAKHGVANMGADWINLGPFGKARNKGAGRVDAIAFHPANADIIYAGASRGGVWKSVDGGHHWKPKTDFLPGIGTASIVVSHADPQTLYVATGDPNSYFATLPAAVHKSRDGGDTWELLSLNSLDQSFLRIFKLVMHPANADFLIAVSDRGIYKTVDGGVAWDKVHDGYYADLEVSPNGDRWYASSASYDYPTPDSVPNDQTEGVFISNDAGDSWQKTAGLPAPEGGRTAIALSRSNANVVYALFTQNSFFRALYRSNDAGQSWTLMYHLDTAPLDQLGLPLVPVDGQADYNLCMAVNPTDPDNLFIGAVRVYESKDGGASWALSGNNNRGSARYIHADHHALEYDPNNELWSGNDGGIYKYETGLNLTKINRRVVQDTPFINIARYNDHLYLSENENIQIYTTALTKTGQISLPEDVQHLEVSGSILVAGYGPSIGTGSGGVRIFDLTDPQNPARISDTPLPQSARSLCLRNNLAYVVGGDRMEGNGNPGALTILDITNPAAVTIRNTVELPENGMAVTLYGEYVLAGHGSQVFIFPGPDNPFGGNSGTPGGVSIIHAPNPEAAKIIGEYEINSQHSESRYGIPSTMAVLDQYLLLGTAFRGVQVVDLHDLEHPNLLSEFHTENVSKKLIVRNNMVWSLSVNGLTLIDLSNPKRPDILARNIETPGVSMVMDNSRAFIANFDEIYEVDTSFNGGHAPQPLWEDRSETISAHMIHAIGNAATDPNRVLMGFQDNGVGFYNNGLTNSIGGNDGTEVVFDPRDEKAYYWSSQGGRFIRTEDDGYTNAQVPRPENGFQFLTPLVFDPSDPDTIYRAGRIIYKSTDQGRTWTAASPYLPTTETPYPPPPLEYIAIAPSNGQVIHTGAYGIGDEPYQFFRTRNGGTDWEHLANSPQAIQAVAIHPQNPDKIWVGSANFFEGPRVSLSEDGGVTWTDKSNGLPRIGVFHLVLDLTNPDHLYAGTAQGVYVSVDAGENWQRFGAKLPNVFINELEIYYDHQRPNLSRLRAATYGRGLWETPLALTQTVATRWMPHVTRANGGFITRFQFTNTNTQESSRVFLQGYDTDGNRFPPTTVTVGPGGFEILTAKALFPERSVSHFSIQGDEALVVSAGYRIAERGAGGTAHLQETKASSGDQLLFKGQWDRLWDGMALVAVGDQTTNITVNQLDQDGVAGNQPATYVLGPKAKQTLIFADLFPDTPRGALSVKADGEVAVIFLRGSADSQFMFQTEPLAEIAPGRRWAPHVTALDGNFETLITLANPKGETATLTLTPYQSDGAPLEPVTVNLEPGAVQHQSAADLFHHNPVSHFAVDGGGLVTLGYRAATDNGATAHVPSQTQTGTCFVLYQGEWETVWDGMALINLSNETAWVDLVRRDAHGMETQRYRLTDALAPNAKLVDIVDQITDNNPNQQISLETNREAAVLFLRGSRAGSNFLYQTAPVRK